MNNTIDIEAIAPGVTAHCDINNAFMKQLCAQYGGQWLPITSDSLIRQDWYGDDCHLNPTGNLHFAQLVCRAIAPKIKQHSP